MDARGSGLPGSSRRTAATFPPPGAFSTPCSRGASPQDSGAAALSSRAEVASA